MAVETLSNRFCRLQSGFEVARVAVFGGSFDPPHMGHVLATQYILSGEMADAVWWVPSYDHRFKRSKARFTQRLALCQLAISHFKRNEVRVSAIERSFDIEGKSLLLMEALQKRYRHHRFSLAIGSDLVSEMPRWYKSKELRRRYPLIVVPRGGERGIPAISSSSLLKLLARRVAGDQHLDDIPALVLKEINKRKLYRTSVTRGK